MPALPLLMESAPDAPFADVPVVSRIDPLFPMLVSVDAIVTSPDST